MIERILLVIAVIAIVIIAISNVYNAFNSKIGLEENKAYHAWDMEVSK
jgi:hypothetical protein